MFQAQCTNYFICKNEITKNLFYTHNLVLYIIIIINIYKKRKKKKELN